MAADPVDSLTPEQSSGDDRMHVTSTGTPAEDREGERTENMLWSLKEDAKWGKDIETQKKAIRDLEKIGAPALGHLEEIWSVIPPGEMRQYCIDAISRIIGHQPSKAKTIEGKKVIETSL